MAMNCSAGVVPVPLATYAGLLVLSVRTYPSAVTRLMGVLAGKGGPASNQVFQDQPVLS
jgi:hypothetical protein